MTKDFLLQQQKKLTKETQQLTPQIYAAIALALHRSGIPTEDIEYIFALSQDIWQESLDKYEDMIQLCLNEANIELRRRE